MTVIAPSATLGSAAIRMNLATPTPRSVFKSGESIVATSATWFV